MTASTIGIAIFALVAFWLVGGVVLRLGGTLLVAAGGLALALADREIAIPLLLAGSGLWLAGRFHHAVRHRA
jgi:hypothetical protein